MPKLTDTQLVILSAAAQREEGAVLPLPKSLRIKGAAVTRTLDGLRRKGLFEERPAAPDAESWRQDDDGRRLMLVITEAGLRAIDGDRPGGEDRPSKPKPRPKKPAPKSNRSRSKPSTATAKPAARPGTKQALLIDMLQRRRGATIEEIVDATGWQAHSVRGAISGSLRKKLGLAISSEKVEGRGRVYRIERPA